MELTDLRSLMTVLSFIAFLARVVWAWTARRRAAFDDAAQLPFAGDDDNLSSEPDQAKPRHDMPLEPSHE